MKRETPARPNGEPAFLDYIPSAWRRIGYATHSHENNGKLLNASLIAPGKITFAG